MIIVVVATVQMHSTAVCSFLWRYSHSHCYLLLNCPCHLSLVLSDWFIFHSQSEEVLEVVRIIEYIVGQGEPENHQNRGSSISGKIK